MSTIVLRNTKGSALTFTEGDANFTNLNTDKLENINSESIGDLSDVDISSNTNGNVLTYNSGTTSLELQAPASSGATQLNELSDVDASLAPSDGQILAYNNSASKFEAQDPGASGIANVVDDTSPQLGGELDAQGELITNPILKDYAETVEAIGSNDSPTLTVANGNVKTVTITSGLALPAFVDAAAGQTVTLIVSGSGSATGTGAYVFAGGNKTLTTTSVVSIFYDGTTYYASIATDFQA